MEKIVVTGYGIKAPGAQDALQFREVLESGLCTHQVIKGIGPHGSDLIGGIVKGDFKQMNGINYKNYPRVARLAIAAAGDAMEMSGIAPKEGRRVSVIMGTSVGGLSEIEQYAELSNKGQFERFPLSSAGAGNPHSLSSAVASHIGASGLVFTLSTGCTAGLDAVLMAKLLLETHQSDVCVIGGSDSPVSRGCVYSFSKMGALAREQEIELAGCPFSLDREGFVIAEGAGVMVLEREKDALRRNAQLYGVIDNIYTNNDGQSIFASDLTGRTMTQALQAVLGPHKPTYMNSQALGLNSNDKVEYIAYRNCLESDVPVTTIKSMVGHAFGASGVMQAIASLISMEHRFIPPTIKTSRQGFFDLPIVTETLYQDIEQIVITSHGYGGNNTCMLLSKYKE
ncbi:beta-ketoacyl-[acyl-carrier-protein] synthase family protein [Paenibacillus nasutitermitis]|uniref:3-oxoacyl-[acyl-carrier-protein] synthase 2 n=1 Tax=Paenibacillus nasutitermitis TaxID=1652958 RepID=A0A917DTL1_9BACL|nr:beta-ketoacyl synthase N-terminal-like domain-containing protein [Paenibacillus nasutitermitis]GGD65878.1 3-oxoacyl-[acyl-carrier-protein] synthase 2 [Paenibacillus nasutitermitis]